MLNQHHRSLSASNMRSQSHHSQGRFVKVDSDGGLQPVASELKINFSKHKGEEMFFNMDHS